MKFYGKAQTAAQQVIAAFKSGDIPAALATRWLRDENIPCSMYSIANQILIALHGHNDARTFMQWKQAGRNVKKGERSFQLLRPFVKTFKDPETDEDVSRLIGFSTFNVFGLDQTEGKPVPAHEQRRQFIESLPLVEIARAWGITVKTFSGKGGKYHGYYSRGQKTIALGVKNLRVWAHELIHAADHRIGSLTETPQHWRSEAVAELGSATLLKLIGQHDESDIGTAYAYINRYCEKAQKNPISVCISILNRVAACVDMILETTVT